MRTTAATILGLVLLAGGAQAQNSRVQQLRQALDVIRVQAEHAPQGAVSSKVDITTMTSAKGTPYSEQILQASGAGRMMTIGGQFSVFEDSEARVVVMDADKMVYIYDQLPGNDKPTTDSWVKAREVLLKEGDITTFQRSMLNGDSILTAEITLREPERGTQLQRVRFVIDITRSHLRSVVLTYAEGAPQKSQRYDYLTYTIGQLDPHLKESAVAQVLSGGKPLPRYRDHRFVDLRQSTVRHGNH